MALSIYQVDAFTAEPFRGNPAAVCVLDAPGQIEWMQRVAAEMNLSETAFVHPFSEGFGLRWFTPKVEVDLCGHATLATAHVLWETGLLPENDEAHFHTRSGILRARHAGDGWIDLDFPADPESTAPPPPELIQAIGVKPVYVGKNRFDYLVEVEHEDVVRSVAPDMRLLGKVTERGVIVTARSDSDAYDFVSRFFAPAAGIDEDPVTGSAHCCLGPFWKQRLHKESFTARQVSARGGVVRVRPDGDRVHLGGQAVTVLRGELLS